MEASTEGTTKEVYKGKKKVLKHERK